MTEQNARNRGDISRAVAAQIRAERAASGLTQRQVMEASGLAKSTYLRMESGERVADIGQLAAFCAAVGVSLPVLLARAEERLKVEPAATLEEHVIRQLSPEAQAGVREGQAAIRARKESAVRSNTDQ